MTCGQSALDRAGTALQRACATALKSALQRVPIGHTQRASACRPETITTALEIQRASHRTFGAL